MTRFADQLFDDLMREHGSTLASTRVPVAPKRRLAARPVLLTAGAGGLAVAATVGTLVAGGGTPAYAMTTHPDGTVTLAVYQKAGIPQLNARLHALGKRVVVVPVGSDCPSITSLRAPAVPVSKISLQASGSGGGPVTVAAQGVPAGDILVVGLETLPSGAQFSMQETTTGSGSQGSGSASSGSQSAGATGRPLPDERAAAASQLTSGSVPGCVSIPAPPAGSVPTTGRTGGSGSCTHISTPVGSLPADAYTGSGRVPESGVRVSISCSSVSGKASGTATHTGSAPASFSNN